jgi:hypothetical protein
MTVDQALRAIKALREGVFDDNDLMAFGPLHIADDDNISEILECVPSIGEADRARLRSAALPPASPSI